ncbi:MAG: menaquinone biosynthesis decarboxylase [Anaerolineales bacterium]|nr:MAG: menaquinone biosynthesis decarboxylase [Anaerolineales bacterium]
MAFTDLSEFVALLEKRGHLKRIKTRVSPELEITEITDRVSKGPLDKNVALLFEDVQGSEFPVLINSLGHPQRMAWALGVEDLEELNHRLAALIDLKLPQGFGATLARANDLLNALRAVGLKPNIVKRAPVQEQVFVGDDVDLRQLPILRCWPQDGGRFITLPTVVTRDPITKTRNVGMYRLQVRDRRTLGMHWQLHKGGAEHTRVAQETGVAGIPVAVSLGGDPAVMWCGSAPLPPGIDEFLLAGWLRGKPVELARCITQPLEVPANAEFVIEGYVNPDERAPEGPFGDHTGYYTPVDDYPVLHVTAITHRHRPVYPTTIVGIPPMEDYWMGKATERLFLPLMKLFMGEVVDVNMPPEGIFHNLVLVSIRKRFPGHARKVINGLWGMGLMMLAKCIIVFDAEVDVQNVRQAMFHALNNVDWARDVIIQEGPTDALDHGSYQFAFGGRIGIDATRKLPEEGYTREWPDLIQMSTEIKGRVDEMWKKLGL